MEIYQLCISDLKDMFQNNNQVKGPLWNVWMCAYLCVHINVIMNFFWMVEYLIILLAYKYFLIFHNKNVLILWCEQMHFLSILRGQTLCAVINKTRYILNGRTAQTGDLLVYTDSVGVHWLCWCTLTLLVYIDFPRGSCSELQTTTAKPSISNPSLVGLTWFTFGHLHMGWAGPGACPHRVLHWHSWVSAL